MELLLSPARLAPLLTEFGVLGLWLLVGLCVYAALVDRTVFEGRGRVPAHLFGPPDAGLAAGLITLFAIVIIAGSRSGVQNPAAPQLPDASAMIMAVVVNSAIFLAVIGGILLSLFARRIDWRQCFGLRAEGPMGIVAWAVVLLALAYPIISGALLLARLVLGPMEDGGEQEVVRFFVGSDSRGARVAVALSAMALAPLQEEFVFRGYLYPVLKRYGGPALGLVVNAALFAGIHLHAPSFAGLFVLAACLTLAYEWTGSLLVPMAMHSLFNSLTVVNLLTRG